MNWLPVPTDFRSSLRAATATVDPSERLQKLADLAQFRLGYLETVQLDNALRKVTAASPPGFARIRVAVLGSSTVEHLLPGIRVAGLRRKLLMDVHCASYGQYRQELLQPGLLLARFAPEVALLSINARDLIGAVPLAAAADESERAISCAVAELRGLWKSARENLGCTVIQQTVLDVSQPLFGSYDRLVPGSPAHLVARLNDELVRAAAAEQVLLLDIARASARDGLDAWFDLSRWLQGKIEIAPQSAPWYGELLARVITAQRGQSKKCLVLDLDNTLWGGVVGDDGIDGIVLGEGSAAGEAYLGVQRYAKLLSERGVILAVCSKNELAIAEAVFHQHPDMVLRRGDIAAFVANWDDKPRNLELIAAQLNIGLDSLVFVDDNPAERARVRAVLPMVAVPELPADAAHYVRCIADAGYFEAVSFTQEDRARAGQYAANVHRETLRDTSLSVDGFLRGLEMSMEFGPISAVDLARATQLINKTNQFNTTTHRYSQDEVARFAADAACMTLQFRLVDRFGDNGLVSVMILRPLPGVHGVLDIDTWVMSCRVFGRQLEVEAMNVAAERARDKGVLGLRADYVRTAKNGVVCDLYEMLGFARDCGVASSSDTSRWFLDFTTYEPRPTFIARKAHA